MRIIILLLLLSNVVFFAWQNNLHKHYINKKLPALPKNVASLSLVKEKPKLLIAKTEKTEPIKKTTKIIILNKPEKVIVTPKEIITKKTVDSIPIIKEITIEKPIISEPQEIVINKPQDKKIQTVDAKIILPVKKSIADNKSVDVVSNNEQPWTKIFSLLSFDNTNNNEIEQNKDDLIDNLISPFKQLSKFKADNKEIKIKNEKITSEKVFLCYNVKRFKTERELKKSREWLEQYNISNKVLAKKHKVKTYSRVYLAPFRKRQQAKYVLQRLGQLGIRDKMLITKGELKNAISLGLYGNKVNIDRRLSELRKKGFRPKVKHRYKVSTKYQLNLKLLKEQKVYIENYIKKFNKQKVIEFICK
jgi:hypothetical protein